MTVTLLEGDCLETLKTLPDCSVQCCVTSPPYFNLRDYSSGKWEGGNLNCNHIDDIAKVERERNRKGLSQNANNLDGGNRSIEVQNGVDKSFQYKDVCTKCGAKRTDNQIGLEKTPEEYIEKLVLVFREAWRVLKDDGTLWVVIGDSYNGSGGEHKKGGQSGLGVKDREKVGEGRSRNWTKNVNGLKPKDLIGIPWMLGFALRSDGWYLRSDIIWFKPNPMPASVKDRPTNSYEHIFLLAKSRYYYYNADAIAEIATGYDGRKDTMFKGSVKNYDGVMPGGNPQTFAQKGHERWRYKNLQSDGQVPNSFHITRANGKKDKVYPIRNKRDVWKIDDILFRLRKDLSSEEREYVLQRLNKVNSLWEREI